MTIKALTRVDNPGWVGYAFRVEGENLAGKDVALTSISRMGEQSVKVLSVENDGADTLITVEPFRYASDYKLVIADTVIAKADMADTVIEDIEKFEPIEDDGVLYRLYTPPKANGPRPLVLFLHGGGESGFDNITQMLGTIGAIRIANDYPDCFVMAPQAPANRKFNFAAAGGAPRMPATFAESDQKGESGWHRKYLAAVCDIIRGMIADGRVNPSRVYVTGMSMGGAGTLRALSVGSDLFAAGLPICPSMTPETFTILKGLVDMKIWITCAYVDHTIYRHKYIVDGILALRDAGNVDARLKIYSPEELAAYDIATDPNMSLEARFGANHACWILAYNNEDGVMGWLMSQTK